MSDSHRVFKDSKSLASDEFKVFKKLMCDVEKLQFTSEDEQKNHFIQFCDHYLKEKTASETDKEFYTRKVNTRNVLKYIATLFADEDTRRLSFQRVLQNDELLYLMFRVIKCMENPEFYSMYNQLKNQDCITKERLRALIKYHQKDLPNIFPEFKPLLDEFRWTFNSHVRAIGGPIHVNAETERLNQLASDIYGKTFDAVIKLIHSEPKSIDPKTIQKILAASITEFRENLKEIYASKFRIY